MLGYATLFASALASATLLPLASEAVLYHLLPSHSPLALWLVATCGNTLGSVINWAMGGALQRLQHKSWFYFKPAQIERAQAQFNKFGLPSLLFAWVPIIGDPLTLVAGFLRVDWRVFIALVALGKGLRYGLIIAIYHG